MRSGIAQLALSVDLSFDITRVAGGLKPTDTDDNLTHAESAAMREAASRPYHDLADARRDKKALNEPDVAQLHFLCTFAEMAGLVEREHVWLRASRLGRRVRHAWRKSAPFDRFPRFEVGGAGTARH